MAEFGLFGVEVSPSVRVRRLTLLLTSAQIGLCFYFLALTLKVGPLIQEEVKNNGTMKEGKRRGEKTK